MDAKSVWNDVTSGYPEAETWWSHIEKAYNANDRHYHNLSQIEHKFTILNELGGASNHRALLLAIFFQYFEYDPREGDFANKNITHFKRFADELKLESDLASAVESLLTLEGTGPDHELLQDLDMAALAVPADEYAELIQKVRKEYNFLSDDAYKSLRKKILQSFLLIPNIFSTDSFRNKFENQARSNIEGEVSCMEKS